MNYPLFFLFLLAPSYATSMHKTVPLMREYIKSKLQEMADKDQNTRIEGLCQAKTAQEIAELKWNLTKQVDRPNCVVLKNIIQTFGWPTVAEFGSDAVRNAWLIAQHADHDIPFQEYCLNHICNASKNGAVPFAHMAYLTDRVLINKGLNQIYGTQFDEKSSPIPLPKECATDEDIEKMNARRAAVGLASIQEYIHMANQLKKMKRTTAF